MILTKCVPSLRVKCVKIPDRKAFLITSLNVLFLSLTSFSFHAEQVFLLTLNTRLWVFTPILFTGKYDTYVSKYSGTTLRLFYVKINKSLKGNVTWPISFTGVELFSVQRRNVSKT